MSGHGHDPVPSPFLGTIEGVVRCPEQLREAPAQVRLSLLAKGVQCPHQILINGRLLGARGDLASPRAVTFAPDGSLLVAEGTAGRVRRFALEPARTATPPGR